MLLFEENNVANTPEGYVVLPISEYNRLRDAAMKHARMFKITQRAYGSQDIELEFDNKYVYNLAMKVMHELFSDEELKDYDIAESINIFGTTLAIRKLSADD